jgi:hydroxymethylbilane synthase
VETRLDSDAERACSPLNHAGTRAAVDAERAVLAALGGGCQVPIGAHATVESGAIRLAAVVISPDAEKVVRQEASGPAGDAVRLGQQLGAELLASGGRAILETVYGPGLLRDPAI